MDCVFCAIARKEIPAKFVYEDDLMVAFADITPVAPTHILIIPRQHFTDIAALQDEKLLAALMLTATRLAKEMNLTDYRLVINKGPRAGQSIFHLHLHLLAGRDLAWPPG